MSTIVMTGGTSGFGAIAVERLALSGNARLILAARRPTSVGESIPLELTELDSVRAFATSIRERLGDTPIDALVLNAGLVLPDVTGRTVDGFETTFAVNHLAHYLLLRLLLPALADRAIVVLTTSGTHDPATRAGLAPPRHAHAELLAHPDRDPDRDTRPRKAGEHAYTASKLCAVLTARSLSEQPDAQTRRLTVIAYDPGQVFGTGLAKDLSFPLRIAWSLLGTPVLGWPLRRLNRNLNSRTAAGNMLAQLALGLATPPNGRIYAALRRGQLSWPAVGTGTQRRPGAGTLERQRQARRPVGLTRIISRHGGVGLTPSVLLQSTGSLSIPGIGWPGISNFLKRSFSFIRIPLHRQRS